MSWLRLDDGFADHPKLVRLSDLAFRQHVRCLCYCARQLTDGIVPAAIAPERKVLDELLAAKLWKRRPNNDFEIKDYLHYNPSRADVHRQRRADSDRKRRGRKPDADDSAGNPPGIRPDSNSPLPLPVPYPESCVVGSDVTSGLTRVRAREGATWDPEGHDEETCERLFEALDLNSATRGRCRSCGLPAARLRVILRDILDDAPETRKRPGGRVWAAVSLALGGAAG